MTDLPGASQIFKGGVVCYTNEVKRSLLGVAQKTLSQYGAVSPQTARELALGACKALGADLAISITGVAGPDPDEGKPVGLVYIGLARGEQVWVKETRLGQARDRIRNSAVLTAFDMVRRLLTGLDVV
jgi:nicotinamide-nucleotide amidase